MSGFSGNVAASKAILRDLAKIASRITRPVAARIDQRMQDCYAGEHDPNLRPWAPLKASTIKRKHGNNVILYRHGKLRAGTIVVPASGAGIRIKIGPAGEYAHDGSPNRQRRRLLPEGRNMPALWRQDIEIEARAYAERVKR